jgi:phosphoribosylglycinamide formyltransferase-1
MLRIGVLVSGGGTNLQSIIDNIENGYIQNTEIVTVVSSRNKVYALERAAKHGIPAVCIKRKDFFELRGYDEAITKHFKEYKVDLVLMAGFLSILGENFIKEFEGRIINIHPSLIPSFCGLGYYGIIPHQKAIEFGVKITGATVHFVELETDTGPIILQKAVSILDDDTPEILQKRVMDQAERVLLPEAVKLYAEGRIKVEGRRVRITH